MGRFLDSLALNGLCTSDKREALLAYPGYVDEATRDMPWPALASSQLLGGRSLSTFVRSPPRQDRVPAWRAARSQGLPGSNHHWHTPAPGLRP